MQREELLTLLKDANSNIKTIKLVRRKKEKDKYGQESWKEVENEYAEVPQRVRAFREIWPSGRIETSIVSSTDSMVIFKAEAYDDEGRLLATGHAQEIQGSSTINKTNWIENAETSAVGRCLGFLGLLGSDSIASAEEVESAIEKQKQTWMATKEQKELISKLYGNELSVVMQTINVRTFGELTFEQAERLISAKSTN